jgi:hypothetical protein
MTKRRVVFPVGIGLIPPVSPFDDAEGTSFVIPKKPSS